MADEKDKRRPKKAPKAPQPVGAAKPVIETFDPSPLLARIDSLENGQKLLTDTVKFVKDANWVLLVVLALGFIALIASFISGIIQVTNSDTSAKIEFIKTIEQLRHDVSDLKIPTQTPKATSSGNTR